MLLTNPNHFFNTLRIKPVVPGYYLAILALVGNLLKRPVIVLDHSNKTFISVNTYARV